MKIDNLEKLAELYFGGLYYLVATRLDNEVAYFKVDTVSNLNDEEYITSVLNQGEKWKYFLEVINSR